MSALESAVCAVLLVSPYFLASDFSVAATARGTPILPAIVSPCRFEQTASLSGFQAVKPPSQTLAVMPGPACDRVLVRLAEAIQQCVGAG